MRKKKPGIRCLPSPRPLSPEDSMDYMESEDYGPAMPLNGKLISPSLSVMITKTIKALCEVNVRFDERLEISGCLHIRSDNQKVLTCLIDEEIDKKEEVQSNHRHEPIVSMLNNTLATALKAKCPPTNLAPDSEPCMTPRPPAPVAHPIQPVTIQPQPQEPSPGIASLEESIRIAVENSRQVEQANAHHHHNHNQQHHPHRPAATTVGNQANLTPPPLNPLPSSPGVNAIGDQLRASAELRDREMTEKASPSSSGSESESELGDDSGHLVVNMSMKKEPDFNYNALPPQSVPQPIAQPMVLQSAIPPISIAPQYSPSPTPTPTPTPTNPTANNNNSGAGGDNKLKQLTIDNIPYETLEVVTAKGGRTKKFQCPFCGIMLSTKGYLKNHINAVHTKTRVYPCDICERLFYSAGALRIHKLRHHWVGSKKHKCHLCKDAFLLPIELRRHLLKKHNVAGNGHSNKRGLNNNNKNAATQDDSSSAGGESGASQEGDASPPHNPAAAATDTMLEFEARMKATQMAAQAHLQMVHDMARISQQQQQQQGDHGMKQSS